MHALRALPSSDEPVHCGNQQRVGVLILPRVLLNPGLLVSFPQTWPETWTGLGGTSTFCSRLAC